MAGHLPGNPSQHEVARDAASIHVPKEPQGFASNWYFSRQELEDHTPSRKDGIEQGEESHMRKLYCSFLQELGMELQVPQVTIATAMMFCHRFYMRQSHAKNCWQTIATVCMFLGCKAEETSRWLSDITVVAYRLMYKWDPSAPRRIKQKEVYDKQKQLILNGERFVLATLAFDLNIEHPYKPLVAALKRLEISDKELSKVAWNFVNDWLRTTLCLQYKPHYIAASSIFLAAKILRVKLPKEKGKVWWMQFDVSPKHLEGVVQQMMRLLEQNQKQPPSMSGKRTAPKPIVKKEMSCSPQSCSLSGSVVALDSGMLASVAKAEGLDDYVSSKCYENQVCNNVQDNLKETTLYSKPSAGNTMSSSPQSSCTVSGSVVAQDSGILASMVNAEGLNGSVSLKCNKKLPCSDTLKETSLHCQASDCGSAASVVEDCEGEPVTGKSDLNSSYKIVSVEDGSAKIDVNRIRETFKKRRRDRITDRKLVEDKDGDDMDSEAWIERELEKGIKLENKRMRL